jgi:ComF family protein
MAGAALSRVLELVFPPQCVACRAALPDSQRIQICGQCRAEMLDLAVSPCSRCGSRLVPNPFPHGCRLCRGERFLFERAVALGNYEGLLRELVYQFKRRYQDAQAYQFGRLLGELCREQFRIGHDVNCVAPTPSHRWRQWSRGMNPAALLAEGVAAETGMEYIPDLLWQRRLAAKQGTLSRAERLNNVRSAMEANRLIEFKNLRVLLVDDVMATGATANEAARTLRAAGIKRIYLAIVARGIGTK